MIKFLIKVVILGAVFYGMAYWTIPDGLHIAASPDGMFGKYTTYLWLGLLFGVVNALVGPVLRFLSLPFIILSLGLFLLVINAALLAITAGLSDKLSVDGFGTAVIGGLILAVVSWVADQVLHRND